MIERDSKKVAGGLVFQLDSDQASMEILPRVISLRQQRAV